MALLRFLSIFILALLTGCAVHAPMSEMIMFEEKNTPDTTYKASQLHGIISIARDGFNTTRNFKYATEVKPLSKEDQYTDARKETNLNFNPIFRFEKIDNLAVSAAFGLPTGVDATYRLPGHIYTTLSADIDGGFNLQGQFILQKRILDGHPFGLSLGGVYTRQNFMVKYRDREARLFEVPRKYFQTNTIGARGVLTLISGEGNMGPGFMYVYFSYNYDLDVEVEYPRIGFSIGLY